MPSTRPASTKLSVSAACTKTLTPDRLSIACLIEDEIVRYERKSSLFFR